MYAARSRRLSATILAVFLAVPLGLAAPAPANDDLTNATTVERLPFDDLVDLSQASVDGRERITEACGGGLNQLTASVWYRYEAPGSGYVDVKARPEGAVWPTIDVFRAHLEAAESARYSALRLAHNALEPVGHLADDGMQRIACDAAAAAGEPAHVQFAAQQDRTYYIRVGSLEAVDLVAVSMKEHLATAPSNDDLADALPLCIPYCLTKADNNGATLEDFEGAFHPCGFHTVWYTVTAGTDGLLAKWDTQGSTIKETVAIHIGGVPAAGPAALGPGSCETDGEGTLDLLPGETAYIGLGSVNGRQGRINFDLQPIE